MSFKKVDFKRGISIIELLVSIAIFVLISVSVLVSYPQMSSNMALEKTTQDIASTMHETRMYSIGIRSFSTSTDITSSFARTRGYGVHFDKTNQSTYTLFSDINEDRMYTLGAGGEETEKYSTYKISGSEKIIDVCVIGSTPTGTDSECTSVGDCLSTNLKTVDILFLRPAPSVFIRGFTGPTIDDLTAKCGSDTVPTSYASCGRAVIIVKSNRGRCKKIEAWTTGQVSVKSQAQ